MTTTRTPQAESITWQLLTGLEPRLEALLQEAQAERATPGYCANARWYGYRGHRGFKRRLVLLVGWNAGKTGDERLRTHRAYDLAYRTVYSALPDCRHPGPIC